MEWGLNSDQKEIYLVQYFYQAVSLKSILWKTTGEETKMIKATKIKLNSPWQKERNKGKIRNKLKT